MDARDRIQSLALVHERLFSSDDYSNIDFGEYARLVIDGEYARLVIVGLVTSFGNSRIEFAIDFSPVIMTVEEAIPAGLILNEALTNILKYAFPPGWAGPERVELRIGIPEGGRRFLEIRDFGIGLPAGFDPEESPSLGCTIMRLLAQQLNGALSIATAGGTVVRLTFQVEPDLRAQRRRAPDRVATLSASRVYWLLESGFAACRA